MPNISKPMGLSPVQYLSGSTWNGQARIYSIAAGYAQALYVGDPVISSGSADTNGVPGIVLYGGIGPIRGVIVGLGKYETAMVNPQNLDIIYRPANDPAIWYAMVVDDPNVLFEVQENSNGIQLSANEIGLNTVLKSGVGNGYYSGWQLPSVTDSAPAVTATLSVRLMGLSRKFDNSFGPYAKHLVKINVHELGSSGTAGV